MKKALIFLLLLSCSLREVSKNELTLKNGIYLRNNKPFSGKIIDKFSSKVISNEFSLVDGIPKGKFTIFGFSGEIIQDGDYSSINDTKIIKFLNLNRISLVTLREGDRVFYTINMVTEQDSTNLIKLKVNYIDSLFVPILDRNKDYNFVFSKGELEKPTFLLKKE